MTATTPSVCILTAGTGRRSGPFADMINKCLLPYAGKAIISHIIDHFPIESQLVVALGYKAEQVRTYLTLMHPERSFTFVEVDRYSGPGTGPGYSLACCKDVLEGSFYFIAGDGIFEKIPAIYEKNWLGISPANVMQLESYCNIAYTDEHQVVDVYDKVQPPEDSQTGVFTGLMFIKDTKLFWDSLENSESTTNEVQIAQGFQSLIQNDSLYCEHVDWQDLGTFELYKQALNEAFDFSKTDEFIYLSDKRVVKFFADAGIAEQRVRKTEHLPSVFPHIAGADSQFFAYDKVEGKTAYEMLDSRLMENLLSWLKQELWEPHQEGTEQIKDLCQAFYHDKTYKRFSLYRNKYPDIAEAKIVNGREVMSMNDLLRKLPASLMQGVPVFIHGDLQFDNIITNGQNFTLIDWRQDFAGETEFGDWYYDLAKLLGGIYLNYDYIKQGLMSFDQQGGEVKLDFTTREEAKNYAMQLQEFVENEGLDFKRVEILRGLIYLNMSPLHHPPFDRLLYAYAQQVLTGALS